ncbi:hypothetical protein [Citrobacter sp. Cb028]|uniref:hypothetical protein n=1 Tax=Citrobacter sp. Cb028 TaxID=2985024 RepID=UPI002575C789|nr:hypothetical protein [Citrobacter sp. Cb028]MDM3455712.1 hypothetical protein [Citrobacter sp. Cb028]
MGSNIIELAKLGHERAAELKASCGAVDARSLAQLISDLATQLEVQLVLGNAQAVQFANAESKCRELAAENAGLKALARGWANATDDRLFEEHGEIFHDSIDACEEELKTICPATDAFLAEVRYQARTDFIGRIEWIIRNECNPDKTEAIISELQKFSDELKLEASQ